MLCSFRNLTQTTSLCGRRQDIHLQELQSWEDIRDALMLKDVLVDFELTFNRPTALPFSA